MRRFFIRLLSAVLIISLAGVLLFTVLCLFFPLPDHIEYSTLVLDDQGEPVHAFLTGDQQWRMSLEKEEITPLLRKTILAKEDRYFYYHPGINPVSMVKALVGNILYGHIRSGASTITMQVARALEPKRRTYWNKLREIFRAEQLELKYSKQDILHLYLNLVPYGGNIEGVKAAAMFYFKKAPDHLSLAEITTLSIIPNRPSSMVIGRNNERIVAARNQWLRRFEREKVFTEKEIADALQEPLTAYRHAAPNALPQLSLKLKKQGGQIIPTCIHMNTQLKLEKLVADYVRSIRQDNIQNAAVVVIDNRTHRVVSYIGSADFHDTTDGGQVNGAAAVRQPGSTLKPLVYGLCIDHGLLTPKQVITDVAVNYQGYTPENFDRKFNGYVTMEYALEHSLNIPAVKSLEQLGKDRLIQSLAVCGFKQVKKDQRKLGLSMVLGGCGATLEELTALYSVFACNGVYYEPQYRAVQGRQSGSTGPAPRMLSTGATFMINDILSKLNRPDFPLNWQSTVHLPRIAWKTGTSYGRRDAWSIGYNRHYTVGIWCGNFSAKGVPDLSGANTATPLLFKIFNSIDYDTDEPWFEQPADCAERPVCPKTGLPPGPYCDHPISAYFIPGVSTTKTCEHVKEVLVSADERISFCRACVPPNGYKKKWYEVVAPDMQRYFDENHIAYQKIPPHNPACERIFHGGGPVIVSPAAGTEYYISKKDPEPLQLRCNTGNDVSRIYWYIDDRFYKSSDAHAAQFFLPDEGPVKISCTDDQGRNRDIRITVRYVNL
ncbi:MAG TPA: penicillin-binding protein 1C [Puia sp.]|nr:penicillin-binding protein 1C [Puia sp.]